MLRTSFIGRPVRKNLAQVIIFGFIIDVCNPFKTCNHIGKGETGWRTSLQGFLTVAKVLKTGNQPLSSHLWRMPNAPIMYVKLEKTFILQACRRSRSLIHNFQRQSKDVGQRSHYSMRISEQFCSRRWVSLLWGLHTLDPRLEWCNVNSNAILNIKKKKYMK